MSVTSLEPSVAKGRFDGISVYSKALWSHTPRNEALVIPYSFLSSKKIQIGKSLARNFESTIPFSLLYGDYFALDPDVDVFHVTDYRVAKMSCPVVCTLHDAIPHIHPHYANPKFRYLKNFLIKRLVRKCDMVIAISNYCVPELVEHYSLSLDRIRVVANGISSEWFDSLNQLFMTATLQKYGLKSQYFLSVGTLQPRKNFERLVLAHYALDEQIKSAYPLVIVGKKSWGCDSLIDLIKKNQEKGYVYWLSDVENIDELRALYQGAAGFVFPSLYEGFGLPILEAFASKTIVITSNTTALPEVSGGIGIEINPLRLDELSSAMEELVTKREKHLWRISAGVQRARKMTWTETCLKNLSVYKELVV